MDKYNKSINILIEDILNEAKSAHIKSYDRSKKVYDEAFKYGKRKLIVKDMLHVSMLKHLSSLKSV